MGGRLVLLCGGKHAPELLAEGRPLAPLAPGRLVSVVPLRETGSLERYLESSAAIVARGSERGLPVPQLADVAGRVEVYGAAGDQLPLVVRSPHGLGEISFAGLDVDEPPLADWPSRGPLLRALVRPYVEPNEERDEGPHNLTTSGYNDLSGAMRQRLGQAFAGVQPFSFSGVVGMSVTYLLLLGPLNYLFAHKLLRRPWVAWITFPLLLAAFGGGALLLAGTRDASSRPAVNIVELVDVDSMSSSAAAPFGRRFTAREHGATT